MRVGTPAITDDRAARARELRDAFVSRAANTAGMVEVSSPEAAETALLLVEVLAETERLSVLAASREIRLGDANERLADALLDVDRLKRERDEAFGRGACAARDGLRDDLLRICASVRFENLGRMPAGGDLLVSIIEKIADGLKEG